MGRLPSHTTPSARVERTTFVAPRPVAEVVYFLCQPGMNLTLPRAPRPRAARHERQGEQTRARHRPDRGAELRPEPGARGHRRERRAPEPIRDPIPPRGARR